MKCPVCSQETKIVREGHLCASCSLVFAHKIIQKNNRRKRKSLLNHHFPEHKK